MGHGAGVPARGPTWLCARQSVRRVWRRQRRLLFRVASGLALPQPSFPGFQEASFRGLYLLLRGKLHRSLRPAGLRLIVAVWIGSLSHAWSFEQRRAAVRSSSRRALRSGYGRRNPCEARTVAVAQPLLQGDSGSVALLPQRGYPGARRFPSRAPGPVASPPRVRLGPGVQVEQVAPRFAVPSVTAR